MNAMARVITLDLPRKQKLISQLRLHNEVIRFQDEPAMASLCTCLGLQFELGNPDYDRLSPFFGASSFESNPWHSEIISSHGELGVRFRRLDGVGLKLCHGDFKYLIDCSSFDEHGELSTITIFPNRVATNFRTKGFELVVVRDWILTSCLNLDGKTRVAYLFANEWEIKNNIAKTQASLMAKRQLAFSGTHDVADHLLNANSERFSFFHNLFSDAQRTFDSVFAPSTAPSRSQLILSYFIGVLLDDLAQPKWYGSRQHEFLARQALSKLPRVTNQKRRQTLALPHSFHVLVSDLRSQNADIPRLYNGFSTFLNEV